MLGPHQTNFPPAARSGTTGLPYPSPAESVYIPCEAHPPKKKLKKKTHLFRLVVQKLFHIGPREIRAVCPCRLVPLLRGKTRNPLAWLQILAYPDAASQAFRSRRTILYTAVPVPLNDIFGPCFLYRDFSDALQHPKIHPWTILANDLVPFAVHFGSVPRV